ncbi:MAG: prepilin peptidase [Clostridia bacterium]
MTVFLNIFIVVCIFIIGSLFGSFFSLATYRIPRKQDIVSTRSYCPTCKHRLEFFDLIPVLSYIFHFGKCRYCGEKISIRYFLLEFLNGIFFVIGYFIFGYTITFAVVALVYAVLFVFVGSYIMKSLMSKEELEEVINQKDKSKGSKKNRESKDTINSKKGVFITELIIAMLLFTLLLASSFIISRNYGSKSILTISRSNAVAVAIRNIEIALGTDYEKLASYSVSEDIAGITYATDITVSKYSDQDFSKKDIVKTINIKVDYMVNGNPYTFELKTLKGKGR